jgi:hypothetical protein
MAAARGRMQQAMSPWGFARRGDGDPADKAGTW